MDYLRSGLGLFLAVAAFALLPMAATATQQAKVGPNRDDAVAARIVHRQYYIHQEPYHRAYYYHNRPAWNYNYYQGRWYNADPYYPYYVPYYRDSRNDNGVFIRFNL